MKQDPDVRVLVLRSADPDFFIAHFDVEMILRFPTTEPLERETELNTFPRLLGRGRALDVILGGADLDAATAERWGYLNRAFTTAAELDAHVNDLAARIAGSPPAAVAAAKAAGLLRTPEAGPAMRAFLAAGGQTRDGELLVGEINRGLTSG